MFWVAGPASRERGLTIGEWTATDAISTFLLIRNALFHQGESSATVQMNGSKVTYGASEYFFNLSILVTLTCVKVIGFDGGHINWGCWIDRQLHR